ncbi:DNA polymerase epsilon catalytic subunit [Tieghemiomyces parasiticus]|uniref:DNA polymerase epsilon catalytic subunit n=1 Tax=Tieghemiomyces parasiticus TaxID=78921 RepID=A0A9W8DTY9_9FUNG|nr:DNA polymerase epsilon catalytic subunit [Tieghemiomyces parasiticus]
MPSVGVIRPNHGHYLDPRRIPLHYVYLFHSRADTRGIFTVINPSVGTADIFVGDGDRGRLQIPNLETLYAERVRAAGVPTDADQLAAARPNADAPHTGFSFAYPPSLTVRTELAKSDAGLAQLANSALHRALEANRGPTMVVLHSAVSADRLTMTLPALREAPYLTMPFHRSDRALPVLDWQRYVTRRLVGHFLNVSQWVHERTALARYADAPVGNIEPDPALFLSDLFLARKLVSQGVVLWWSSSRRPDLGGREEDEHGWLGDMGNQGALELSHPGLYPGVCVEIEVGNLAVNTVLASHLIHELEGGALDAAAPSRYTLDATVGDDPGPAVATESSASAALPLMSTGAMGDAGTSPQVFQLLRSLVRGWYTEVARHRYAAETSSKPTGTTEPLAALATRAQLPPKARTAGPVTAAPNHYYAEIMTQHFYHWLTHPGSKLYDPCLYALVQGLMRKVLLQLLAELRRLGVRVVFASFQKIIVATSKVTRTAAAAYTQYLLKTVTAQPLFDQIDLNPVEVWDRLLWMDPSNFGGVLSTTATVTGGTGKADADESASSAGGQKIEMSWNLREYLPPAIQNDFELLIAEFIYALHTHHAKQRGDAASLSVAVATGAEAGEVDPEGTAGPREDEPENTPIEDPTFARTLVGQRLTRKLFRLIPEIHAKCAPLPDAEPAVQVAARFPRLPGSYLPLTNPALEFIKSACAVLGLVDGASREVRVMKRNALDLIGIREFSPEAIFHNPSQSLQLPQVICEYCHYCRDLDFCRDADLLPVAVANPGPNAPGFQSRPWLCVACRHEYDRAGIELALVQLLLRRVQVYQLQDLRCSKCRMVKAENLRSHCPACAAPFVSATITQADLLRQVSIFRNVARFHQLPLLTETAEWILQNETRAAS